MEALLKKQIHQALNQNPHLPVHALHIETDSGKVILSGKVPSWYQKQMAQEALRAVDGIAEICNELTVIQPKKRAFFYH